VNYRHFFHAGNVADVFKHLVLVRLVESLKAKDKPFCVIDTHAGGGIYRLDDDGEYREGIGQLWPEQSLWTAFETYFSIVRRHNSGALANYPGSPILIADLLRAQDRLILVERNPDEYRALATNMGARPGVTLRREDGFATLRAVIPPRENRGLVFIDPPYELASDFASVVDALRMALGRWRNGVYAVWYPIKDPRAVRDLHKEVCGLNVDALAAEFLTLPEDVPQRLNGSGMLLVNPPFRIDDWMSSQLPALAEFLSRKTGHGRFRVLDLSDRAPMQEP